MPLVPSMRSTTSHKPWFTSTSECVDAAEETVPEASPAHSADAASAVAEPRPPCRCASMPGLYAYARPSHAGGSRMEQPGMPMPHMDAPAMPRRARAARPAPSEERACPAAPNAKGSAVEPSPESVPAVATTPAAAATASAALETRAAPRGLTRPSRAVTMGTSAEERNAFPDPSSAP